MAAALLMAAQVAAADESGTFRMLRSYWRSYVTIDHGAESFTGGTLQGTYSIIASSGAPFVDGVHGRSECLVYSRTAAAGISLEAPCVNVDAAGDRFHVVSIREEGTIEAGGGGAGRWELRGGTEHMRELPDAVRTRRTTWKAAGWSRSAPARGVVRSIPRRMAPCAASVRAATGETAVARDCRGMLRVRRTVPSEETFV